MTTDPDRNQRIRDLFVRALELEPGARGAFVADACGEDRELHREVSSLLSFATEQKQPDGLVTGGLMAQVMLHQPGDRIGPYVIVRALGSGAMGDVFLATQDEPRRHVALKVLRPGCDANTVARFRLESTALARMNHEHIARVYATGEAEEGRPYIALELVPGTGLTRYVDDHRLNVRQRLTLIMTLCDALEHIHQNGLIHRDLKPSNIVVLESPQGPSPKVIDFGIAKSLVDPLQDGGRTVDGALLGTLEYASPEQLTDSRSVDTRTDIYSAGVILYELLASQRPFGVHEQSFTDFLDAVRRDEPEAPSAALQRDEGHLASVAAARSTTPGRLLRALRSDLDWIVLKALRKDPSERYASAGALRADLQRHLSGEAVHARPPGGLYRARKALARHRRAVIASAIVLLSLATGLGATLWQARVARARLSQLETLAADLVASMNDIVDVPGAMQAKERLALSAAQALEQIGSRSSDPAVAARLATAYERLGQLRADPYTASLGQTALGIADLRRAVAIRKALHDRHAGVAEALDLMQSSFTLAILLQSSGGTDADSLLREAIALGEPIVERDSSAFEVLRVLSMIHDLHAEYEYTAGHWNTALDLIQRSRAIRERLVRQPHAGDEPERLLGQSLGRIAYATQDPREARACALEALRIHDAYHRAHPFSYRALLDLSFACRNAAYALRQNGSTDSAIALYRRGAELRRTMVLSDSTDLRSLHLLTDAYDSLVDGFLAADQVDSALGYAQLALAIRNDIAARPNAPPWSNDAIWASRRTLARAYAHARRFEAAESLYQIVCWGDVFVAPTDGVMELRCELERAEVRIAAGDAARAAALLRGSAHTLETIETTLRTLEADAIPFGDLALVRTHLAQMDVLSRDERVALLRRGLESPHLEEDPRAPRARLQNELACLLACDRHEREARALLQVALSAPLPEPLRHVLAANLASLGGPVRIVPRDATRDPYTRLDLSVFRRWPVWGEIPVPPPSRLATRHAPRGRRIAGASTPARGSYLL